VKRSNYAKRRSISITFFIDMSINVDIFMHYIIVRVVLIGEITAGGMLRIRLVVGIK